MKKSVIPFTKVALPYGWLGNMSPFQVEYDGKVWRTTEALFQALRFSDESIRELIREQKSPMSAKMIARKHREFATVTPLGQEDVQNMLTCLNLKLENNPSLIEELIKTEDSIIVEDVTARGNRGSNLFWGARYDGTDWSGQNVLGELWMQIRLKVQHQLCH